MLENSSNNKVEDIFDSVDKRDERQRVKKVRTQNLAFQQEVDNVKDEVQESKKSGIKNIIIIVAIMIGTVVIVGGIIFAVQSFMNRTSLVENEGQLSDLGMPNSNDEVRVPASVVVPDNEEETKVSTRDDDSDGDGLSNSDELKYKTNLNKVDTDDDGLFDGEEVNFFKTNPTNSDTDSDGFLDGEEVRNGFDPNGDGKLLNFEEALKKLKK